MRKTKAMKMLTFILTVCIVLQCVYQPAFAISVGAADMTETVASTGTKETPAPEEAPVPDEENGSAEEQEELPTEGNLAGEAFVREETVDGIKITVTADSGVFPDEAVLSVSKVEDAATEAAIEEAIEEEKTAEEAEKSVGFSFKFDIKMLLNGEEIQPDTDKGRVFVSFTRAEFVNDSNFVNVYHVAEENSGLTAEALNATVEEAGTSEAGEEVTVTAETDGFSYYVIELFNTEGKIIVAALDDDLSVGFV